MIELESIYSGSTFYGAEFEFYDTTEEKVPVDLTGSTVKMNLVDCFGVSKEFATTDDTLTIDYNKLIIEQQEITLTAGVYDFDLNIEFENGEKQTGLARGSWTILDTITK